MSDEIGWQDDPASDERWSAGLQFGMDQLCTVLGVDHDAVSWDAATETLDGDVASVIGNILTARFGDAWVVTFQQRVAPWMQECFGPEISADKVERNHRFIEEALELVQANGMSREEAHQLVEYVYGRDQGDINQEVGGVMVTLAALCLANDLDMHAAAETELARIWKNIDKIRAKQAAKPRGSALPQ